MPNRIIKESLRSSRSVNALTDFQFRLWVYLITYVDDYGRGSADPELLKGFVFPRRKGITEAQIQQALLDLANTGMVILYEVDGEPYFYFPNWGEHQRIQTKKSKFPAPPENATSGGIQNSAVRNGVTQKPTVTHGDSRWNTVDNGNPPPESNPNPIQNPNTNTNPNPTRVRARGGSDNAEIDFTDLPLEDLLNGNVRLANSAREWIRYKQDRGDNFGEASLKKTISEFNFYSQTFSDDQICSLVDHCIASTYSAITWDKLRQPVTRNIAQEQLDMIDNW